MTQEDILLMLDKLYENTLTGIGKVSVPIEKMAEDYLQKNADTKEAAKSFVNYQIAKCTTSGFVTGLGGLITLPVAIPANISSVLYVQMRMIAGLAYMGGYDVNSDQVQSLVYACLAGVSVDQILKKAGIQCGEKFAKAMINKIPGKALQAINKKVGFRFITKAGTKGVVNLTKMLPLIGGVVGGGLDLVETKVIAARAYKMFIENDFSMPDAKDDDTEILEGEVIE